MVINCHKYGYIVIVATNLFIVIFLTSNMVISQIKNITCFIKAVVFHHVGLLWMIETEEQYNFAVDEHYE